MLLAKVSVRKGYIYASLAFNAFKIIICPMQYNDQTASCVFAFWLPNNTWTFLELRTSKLANYIVLKSLLIVLNWEKYEVIKKDQTSEYSNLSNLYLKRTSIFTLREHNSRPYCCSLYSRRNLCGIPTCMITSVTRSCYSECLHVERLNLYIFVKYIMAYKYHP